MYSRRYIRIQKFVKNKQYVMPTLPTSVILIGVLSSWTNELVWCIYSLGDAKNKAMALSL